MLFRSQIEQRRVQLNTFFDSKTFHQRASSTVTHDTPTGTIAPLYQDLRLGAGKLGEYSDLLRNSGGGCICCGVGMGATREGSPFTVQGGQVYVNQVTLNDGVAPQPFILVNGETYVSSTRLSELGVTFQGGKDTNGSVVVQSDDHKASTQGWKFDNSNGDFELNSDTTKIKKTGDVVSVFDENGTLRTRIQL